jgi:4-alpha-glucanotransferase
MILESGKRSAGILLHISSLPSPYGIGDLGPDAYRFADFCQRSGQTYWQFLPLNPTTSAAGHSPYSAYCSMAGNPLLISPDILYDEKLVTADELNESKIPGRDRVDFEKVLEQKTKLLDAAFTKFTGTVSDAAAQLEHYAVTEKFWLEDFAIFSVVKEQHNNAPWYEWPEELRTRDPFTLKKFSKKFSEKLDRIRWEQMVFDKQFSRLKTYCNERQVRLLGDLPLYVWSNPGLFQVDKAGQPLGVAGVPPDAFSKTGQRWGMPVYNWELHAATNFEWWVERIAKNLGYVDLLRIDHFRALSSYYEIPASSETAAKGSWKPAPGDALFGAILGKLGKIPFVAEDLGKIDEDVLKLRDRLQLPGMNVLQFAFGENMAWNSYIPHHHHENSVVYTGTHDNPTTKGWFSQLSHRVKRNLHLYTGRRISGQNITAVLMRMAYSSVSRIAIIPLQDVLELDDQSRMNDPSGKQESWTWRVDPDLLIPTVEKMLLQWCLLYDRIPDIRTDNPKHQQ